MAAVARERSCLAPNATYRWNAGFMTWHPVQKSLSCWVWSQVAIPIALVAATSATTPTTSPAFTRRSLLATQSRIPLLRTSRNRARKRATMAPTITPPICIQGGTVLNRNRTTSATPPREGRVHKDRVDGADRGLLGRRRGVMTSDGGEEQRA